MSVHPTLTRLPVVGGVLALLAIAPGMAGATTGWTDISGNPGCSVLGSGYRKLKLEPISSGTRAFNDGRLSGVIDVSGVRFDWSAGTGVAAVIVKGGPNARIYRAASVFTSGTGLHAPVNPSNGTPYG